MNFEILCFDVDTFYNRQVSPKVLFSYNISSDPQMLGHNIKNSFFFVFCCIYVYNFVSFRAHGNWKYISRKRFVVFVFFFLVVYNMNVTCKIFWKYTFLLYTNRRQSADFQSSRTVREQHCNKPNKHFSFLEPRTPETSGILYWMLCVVYSK